MKIVHFAPTQLAGAPQLLVDALKRHSNHDVRLVNFKCPKYYDPDIVFSESPEDAILQAESADIIHLHNSLDLDSDKFAPIDFRRLREAGTLIVRQFHSHPETVARKMRKSEAEVVNDEIPSLVVAQFQESFYPNARVVPNIVPTEDPLYRPVPASQLEYDIVFTPSGNTGAWESRWNTKGAPETRKIVGAFCSENGLRFETISGVSLQHALEKKQRALVVLDEMITGSYHLSGLEGLSQGKAVVSYISGRTERVTRWISGAASLPFINSRLEDVSNVLHHVFENRALAFQIGSESRTWMERYWSEEKMVEHYMSVYDDLRDRPDKVSRQHDLRLDTDVDRFFAVTLPDLFYASRRTHFAPRVPMRAVFQALQPRRLRRRITRTGVFGSMKKKLRKRRGTS